MTPPPRPLVPVWNMNEKDLCKVALPNVQLYGTGLNFNKKAK